MHYANGREAKNGDKVILIPALKGYGGPPKVGILYDAKPGNDLCNGYLAQSSPMDPVADLSTCLHYDDVVAAFKKE